ncbi:MAG: 4-alpha-glucanotransferase [Streptosporangiaceae bacterium]|nr:4-alpha-glucanotransferase [Streptosporangiaceae bacterium]
MTTRSELRDRAQARNVAVCYQDWRGRRVEVADETLAAVLDALGDGPANAAARVPHDVRDGVAPFPSRRSWGFTVQLYSLRSRASWGHGDLRDLADLAAWSGRALGADFVVVNPLHAAEPLPPVSPSPYLPMSRRHISPLYLRIEDIPEYAGLDPGDRARVDALAGPLRAASATAALIDRDAVWDVKRAALQIIRAVGLGPRRSAELAAFRARDGGAADDWGLWCAIAERHGPDWRSWPGALADPGSAEVKRLRGELADRVDFHAWLQWLAAEQAAAAQHAARQAGMRIGVIADLAVGAHPGGADAWAGQDVVVAGISVGAPPDEFNQRGQDWALPPWHPERLAELAGGPLAELVAAATRDAGGMRVDHVMGLARLWWIPAGMTPQQGTYVRYDHELLGGVLAGQVSRAGALAIGEDLGTVESWLRGFLASRRILGTSMLWFERRADGTPRRPRGWRRGCLATVGTHDMPPAAAFLTGDQVALRAGLGLLTRPEREERAAAEAEAATWLAMLACEGLLAGSAAPSPEQFTTALYAYLTRTQAMLIGVSLAEAAGERRPQNMPGTTDEYPNWQIPLTDRNGDPVLLEDLPGHRGALAVADTVSAGLRRRTRRGRQDLRLRTAAAGELRVWHRRADVRAAEPGQVGRAVLGVLAERLDGGGQDVAEVPHAPGAGGAERGGRRAHGPERVELRADRRDHAARAGGRVAQERRAGGVGLELDLRVRLPVGLERPDVLERRRMVPGAVRPGVRHIVDAVVVQVTVLVAVGLAPVGYRAFRAGHAVDGHRPGALGQAGSVGVLAERGTERVVGGAGLWPVRPLRL